jgi:hypothetical protein
LELVEMEGQLVALVLMVAHHQDLEHQQQVAVEAVGVVQLMALLAAQVVEVRELLVAVLVGLVVRVQLAKVMLEVQVFLLP